MKLHIEAMYIIMKLHIEAMYIIMKLHIEAMYKMVYDDGITLILMVVMTECTVDELHVLTRTQTVLKR